MRSIRFKLILTLLIISMAGTLITTLIVRMSTARAVDVLLAEQNRDEFISDALAYYEANGSWEGVADQFGVVVAFIPGQPPESSAPFALVDTNNRVLIPNGQMRPDSIVSEAEMAKGFRLMVDGEWVGSVFTDNQPLPRNPAEEAFVADTNRALLFGALGATLVAVGLAFVMARTFTQPLRELSRASRQMAEGDLQQAVPVRTNDELGELAAAFNQMSAELDRVNQARRQMTADIAHDLRTPLTVLAGYLEAMEDGTLAPTPERLALMQQEVSTLQGLVADLRTLSLADTGHLTLQKEPVAVADLLAQVHDAFARHAAQQEINLQLDIDPALPSIALDAARMRQALGNIVSNALRYTPSNGAITLAAGASGEGGVQITVADTGTGISAADLPHIFDRFFRGDRSRQGHGESGLGLAIARSLVVAHGGTITVASTVGQGTTFTITLPG